MMRHGILFLLTGVLAIGGALAAFHPFAAEEPSLARFTPSGALLVLEANDFSSLLSSWNTSVEKKKWVDGSNYKVFSESRLFLRLKEASDQFAAAAGLPADMKFVSQVAGTQSAVALYDIGKLQFLYVTKIGSTSSQQTTLWQSRMKFEPRNAGGVTFYVRRDPESNREVAFAIKDEYLLLATRADLLAGALQLMAGGKEQTVESEPWWRQSTGSAGNAGDLRLVLNLEKIVPSPYFRSYWIQKNITDMKQYSAAVSDLFVSSEEYREERVLVKKTATAVDADGAAAVADVARLVPEDAGLYQVRANPSPKSCLELLETKILAPHSGPGVASPYAPQVQLGSGATGSSSDLETRIDQPPLETGTGAAGSGSLANLLQKNPLRASLLVQSSETGKDGVFVRFHSAIVLLGTNDWNDSALRAAFADFVQSALTASQLGLTWQQKQGYQVLDGLWPLSLATRGKYLVVSDDPLVLTAMAARLGEKPAGEPALFLAGFRHAQERPRFLQMMSLLDNRDSAENSAPGRAPQFFSENIGSLSGALSDLSAERISVRDAGDKVLQTVHYKWGR